MEARDWILTLSVIGNFASGAWAYFDQRGVKIARKIEELERGMSSLKATTEAAPTHNDLGKVYDAMRQLSDSTNKSIHDLASTVNQLVGENRSQTDQLRLILHRITDIKGNHER